jgi:hypothetical protein
MRSRKIKAWLASKVLVVLNLAQRMKACLKVQVQRRALLAFSVWREWSASCSGQYSLGQGTWHPQEGMLPGFTSSCQHTLDEQTIRDTVTWTWI